MSPVALRGPRGAFLSKAARPPAFHDPERLAGLILSDHGQTVVTHDRKIPFIWEGQRQPWHHHPACSTKMDDDTEALRHIATRLVRAVDTLGRLPRAADIRPAGIRSAWPEMIRASRFVVETTRNVPAYRSKPYMHIRACCQQRGFDANRKDTNSWCHRHKACQ